MKFLAMVLHAIHGTYRIHWLLEKDGIGTVFGCTPRKWSWHVLHLRRTRCHFKPDLDGAAWHCVPDGIDGVGALLEHAASPFDVMARLREAK